MKDDPANVGEWVDYHAALGVGKFYLMVTDDPHPSAMELALEHHTATGLVDLYFLPRVNPQTINLLQVRLYAACLESVRELHQFIGFWDVDEFLVNLDPFISFPDFLRKFEHYGGLAVGWRVVGPSNHLTKPSGGILRNYKMCTPWDFIDNEEIKSIVNTKYAVYPTSDPHTFEYKEDKYLVDAEGVKVEEARNEGISAAWRDHCRHPKLALYHYVTKSEEEYREKMRRGSAMGNRKDWGYFRRIDEASVVPCDEAVTACAQMGLPQCSKLDPHATS